MTARVISLAYLRMGAESLATWVDFAERFIGAMVAERSDDRLLLRLDHYSYRFDIRPASAGGVQAVGWEVKGPQELAEIRGRLTDAGFEVRDFDADQVAERRISGGLTFRDPDDNFDLEVIWGLKSEVARFASKLGAEFVAGDLGLGHLFQVVTSEEAYARLYFDIFGFLLSDHIDFPGPAVGVFTHCNPRHHSFAFSENTVRRPGIGHFMVETTELDIIGRCMDLVDSEGVQVVQTFGKHTNDKMVSLYIVTPSDVAVEFGTGGILIDDDTWRPVRYDAAHYWGHKRDQN